MAETKQLYHGWYSTQKDRASIVSINLKKRINRAEQTTLNI